ncbi:putative gustatory receptor clone PTE01 [Myripristis murdjan]|uniref:Olfactory receptor n=1 Tax=Myripristis murdjan TaxID=586833 RepID=A0A667X470_9TELE|nr:putative gustatory receptor clone PTE01 [Myripristis murdjan]
MENSTQIVSFVLTAYGHSGHMRYLYFTILMSSYLSIICANTMLIGVICGEGSLHEPMYLLLCGLFVNEVYGSTIIFPCFMTQMFSDTHEVSFIFCLLQLFCLYTYGTVEYCNLAAMAYDRYVSICHPLHYSIIMTTGKVCSVLLLVWLYSLMKSTLTVIIIVHQKFCGNQIDKVICEPTKMACSISAGNNVFTMAAGFVSFAVPLIPILFSYIKILAVCLRTSREARQKAVSTCCPQLVSLANFAIACFFEVLQSKVEMTHVPSSLRIILSVYLLVCQPLLSPIIYGLNLTRIRTVCKNICLKKQMVLKDTGVKSI